MGKVILPDWVVPWKDRTADNRLPPRECVGNARTALDRAYGLTGAAPYPLLIEAVDWLRRALEQMAPPMPTCPDCGFTLDPGEEHVLEEVGCCVRRLPSGDGGTR